MRNFIRKSVYIGVLVFIFSGVVSCEKNFTDINTRVVENTKFNTKEITLEVQVTNAPIDSVISDGLSLSGGVQGQYLLGHYASDEYEDVEASIISQIAINTASKVVSYDNPDNLEVVTTIDTVFLKLPYQATLESNKDRPIYKLDSVIGNQNKPFILSVYELDTYLSRLNQTDPSKVNEYLSTADYQNKGIRLNEDPDLTSTSTDVYFTPSVNDTLVVVKRKTVALDSTEVIKYTATSNTSLGLPVAIIPLKKDFAQRVFLDNFEDVNFASQEKFNEYFKGIVIEAKKLGTSATDGGSLISFSFTNASTLLRPSIEIFYTNTFLKNGVKDTVITRSHSFPLSGIVNNQYKMPKKVYPIDNNIKIQGLAGSEATVKILNGTELSDLKNKNWLINDAALTFYVNQSSDTTITPTNLFLYKKGKDINNKIVVSQIKDSYTEKAFFGGSLERNSSDKKDKYVFKITDYISDLLSGETNYNPSLRLKVYNPTDTPVNDTIYRNYNWSPKAVTLLNHNITNSTRRAQLKISYTEKK